MDEQMIEPCPFCAGEGLLHRVPWGWQVTCEGCGAAPRSSSNANRETEEGAVGIWNRRAAHSVIAGKVAELTEALEQVREFAAHRTNEAAGFGLIVRAVDTALAPYPERRHE